MRAPLSSLLLASACLAGFGCASKSPEKPAVASASTQSACANDGSNSLHLTSQLSSLPVEHDAEIESVLAQQTSDGRLAQINRHMYQSLRSLDAELRREERVVACERAPFGNSAVLSAQTDESASSDAGVAPGVSSATTSAAVAAASTSNSVGNSAAAGASVTHALHRTGISPSSSGGGNGATAPSYRPGSDNQVVARRLKKAAEQETNPSLRAKLWKEYTEYVQGASGK